MAPTRSSKCRGVYEQLARWLSPEIFGVRLRLVRFHSNVKIRHSDEAGHRVTVGARYPRFAAKRAPLASEPQGNAQPRSGYGASVPARPIRGTDAPQLQRFDRRENPRLPATAPAPGWQ